MEMNGPDDRDFFLVSREICHFLGVQDDADNLYFPAWRIKSRTEWLVGDDHEMPFGRKMDVGAIVFSERIGLDVNPIEDSFPFDHVDNPSENDSSTLILSGGFKE